MKKFLICLMLLACLLFLMSACGNKSKTDVTETINQNNYESSEDASQSVNDVSLDYDDISSKATLQYESQNGIWRYQVYKDNTGNYDCYVALQDYLLEIPVDLEIPAEIDGYPVIGIIGYDETSYSSIFGKASKSQCYNEILKSVLMPDSIIYVGNGAFRECRSLTDVKWSQNITEIGYGAFMSCSLYIWNPPQKLKTIYHLAFEGCNFTEIVIPDTVTFIGQGAFDSCPLSKVVIPANVTYIGENAFYVYDKYGLEIHGYAGSEAAKYCASENITFKVIN